MLRSYIMSIKSIGYGKYAEEEVCDEEGRPGRARVSAGEARRFATWSRERVRWRAGSLERSLGV
jgi:hypothetical protein